MRSITGVLVGVVTALVAMVAAAPSFASSFGPAPTPSTLERESSLWAKEMAVLTDQGIAPARAGEALRLQARVSRTGLAGEIGAALGGSYAGVWFDPPAAKLDVGVTSPASARLVGQLAHSAGLGASVVARTVRSTWAQLLAAQGRWHARLSKLLARGDAQTGLNAQSNAVDVTLSSAVPASETAALRRKAAADGVNVSITVQTPAQMGVQKDAKCTNPFVANEGYCEPTIVSGVAISRGTEPCTSGPMLLEGNETYMVTAGHCFGGINGEGGTAVTAEVTSRYTPAGAALEIGKTGRWYNNKQRDMAIVRVNRAANNFTLALPNPVPALMAEWEKEPENPHAVNGVTEAAITVPAQILCKEGRVTGEQCGEVLKLNVEGAGTEHLVEVRACAMKGDSGGPFFFRDEVGNVLMVGIHVASNQCEEPLKSYLEPLRDLEGSPEKGILSTFFPKELLTKSNENRTATVLGAKWLVAGVEVTTELPAELEGEFTLTDLKTLLGVAEALCGSLFTATLLKEGEALINEMLSLEGVAISLTALSGTALLCTNVKNCTEPLVWAVHLPWTALLELEVIEESTNEPFAVLIKPAEGNPGFYVECMGGLPTSDECTASELIAEVKNGETAAELVFAEKLREELFAKLATCSIGGSETGHLTTGTGDANELVTSTGGTVTVGS